MSEVEKKTKKQTTSLEPPCLYSDCDSSPGCRTRVSGPPRCSRDSATSGPDGVRSTSGSLITISSPPSARRRSGGGPAAAPPRPRLCRETPANSQSRHTVSACFSSPLKTLYVPQTKQLFHSGSCSHEDGRRNTPHHSAPRGDGGRHARIPQVQSHR